MCLNLLLTVEPEVEEYSQVAVVEESKSVTAISHEPDSLSQYVCAWDLVDKTN